MRSRRWGLRVGTDPSWAGQTTSQLATMNVPALGSYQFTYDSAGASELDQVTFPYGRHLRWIYQNFQYWDSHCALTEHTKRLPEQFTELLQVNGSERLFCLSQRTPMR
jgi:hypothetical protein